MRRLLALLLLTLAVPAAAHAEVVATPGVATPVREHAGILVWTQLTAPTQRGEDPVYRLAIRRPGGQPELLDGVPPSANTFDADIGPDSAGRPAVVFRRCDDTCDLRIVSLEPGARERAIRNANDPGHDDVAPTLWRGRIAWSRIYGEQADRKVIVYTKELRAPRSRPSTRLPGVPSRATFGRTVEALELWGANLGQVVRYGCADCGAESVTEVRLVRVPTRASRQIAFQRTGLGGQSWAGPSFANGKLEFYRSCLGDQSACVGGRRGPYRYTLSLDAYARFAGGPIRVHGFAGDGTYLYEVADCSPETLAEGNERCRIERVPLPDFEETRPPR